MPDEDESRRPWVTFGFSRSPKPSFEEDVERDARASRDVRLSAVIKDGDHGYKSFLIIYTTTPGEGFATAHRVLGTQVAHEAKVGPLGLKTR